MKSLAAVLALAVLCVMLYGYLLTHQPPGILPGVPPGTCAGVPPWDPAEQARQEALYHCRWYGKLRRG